MEKGRVEYRYVNPKVCGTPITMEELLQRAERLSKKSLEPEYLFEEQKHPDMCNYEKLIIDAENGRIRP
jgi:hypothetical protein